MRLHHLVIPLRGIGKGSQRLHSMRVNLHLMIPTRDVGGGIPTNAVFVTFPTLGSIMELSSYLPNDIFITLSKRLHLHLAILLRGIGKGSQYLPTQSYSLLLQRIPTSYDPITRNGRQQLLWANAPHYCSKQFRGEKTCLTSFGGIRNSSLYLRTLLITVTSKIYL